MPPHSEIVTVVKGELANARPWAERKGLELNWEPDDLRLRTVMTQEEMDEPFYLQGVFDDYKETAPAWEFYDSSWSIGGQQQHYPSTSPCPFGSSIFHSDPFICVPFNRLAYEECGGRHSDWGGPGNWLNVEGGNSHATRIGGMLQQIYRHLRKTRGRMG